MGIKCKVICCFVAVVTLLSCGRKGAPSDAFVEEAEEVEMSEEQEVCSDEEDSLAQVPLFVATEEALDSVFNDFLFAYLHSRALRRERTAKPLRLEHPKRPTELLEQFDPEFEFSFLSGEFFTTLYGSARQMQAEDDDELEEDTIVSLQRINLNDGTIRNFLFQREEGHWKLDALREETFEEDELCDFLTFYAHFCSDSLFQSQSIADPLRIVIQDTEDEDGSIDGIIDADQWQTFCPEVPSGIISNIRKGQDYSGNRIVMRKSGLSNGLQEIFTFSREKGNWRLTKYEN